MPREQLRDQTRDEPRDAPQTGAPDKTGGNPPDTRRVARFRDLDAAALWRAVVQVWHRIGRDRIVLIGAGMAFYMLLALFPAITALVAVTGIMLDPTIITQNIEPMLALLPEGAATIILDQVNGVVAARNDSLGLGALIALGLALYSASKGAGTLIQGLNVVYAEDEGRGFFAHTATVLGLTLFLVVMAIVMIATIAVIPALLAWFGDAPWLAAAAQILRWPIVFGLAMLTLSILYHVGPSRRAARWRWIAPGSFVACALWVAGTAGFALYVQKFASYNETFGALGGVIILLTWLWLTALCALIGALIDAEIEAQLTPDTTVGPPRAPGERGAVKADSISPTHQQETTPQEG